MRLLVYLSDFMIPLFIFYVVGYAVLNKNNVYDDFVRGAKDGIKTVAGILPTLIGLMVAVGILRSSGFLEWLCVLPSGLTEKLGMPSELLPVMIVRMFSSSAATGLVLDIFKEHGTDSRIGLITSIMMSCTETIFYTMSVYCMAARVKRTRYTLSGALLATLAGVAASIFLAGKM